MQEIPEGERISWRKHTLKRGETLGQLARRYRTRVSALMDLNGIRNARRVRAGTVLTIPYPRGASLPTVSQASRAAESPRTNAGEGQKTIRYRVRSGDTLSSIAAANGTSVSRIQRANGLRGHRIRAGSDLWIHVDSSHPAPAVTFEKPATEVYVVRRGDTLSEISRRFGIRVADLLAWNSLRSSQPIHPGDEIRVTPPPSR